MNETTRLLQWAYGRLTADGTLSALGVYQDGDVPQQTAPPYITIGLNGPGLDTVSLSARVVSRLLLRVEIVTDGPLLAQQDVADRIDTQLDGQAGTVGTLTIARCLRASPFADWGAEAGTSRRHLGGVYAVMAHA